MTLASRLATLARELEVASRQRGTGVASLLADAVRLRRLNGYGPREAIADGLLEQGAPRDRLAHLLPKHRMVRLQERTSPIWYYQLTEDKVVFDAYCRVVGLPVPRLLAVLERPNGWTGDGQPLAGTAEWARFLEREAPAELLCKPADGALGSGVRVFAREGAGFRDAADRTLSAEDLYRELSAGGRRLLLQERLRGHPELARLSGTPTLQTLRLVTLVTDDGAVSVGAAFLRIVASDAVTDNFAHGHSGNFTALVDPVTGVLECGVSRHRSGIGVEVTPNHPRTGLPIDGFVVPDFAACCELACRAARLFLPLRTVGWDVAPTPEGPVLVEGNVYWDAPNDTLLRTRSAEAWRRWLEVMAFLRSPDRPQLRPPESRT